MAILKFGFLFSFFNVYVIGSIRVQGLRLHLFFYDDLFQEAYSLNPGLT